MDVESVTVTTIMTMEKSQERYDNIRTEAARRVGSEPKKQLAWLLEFAQRDERSFFEGEPLEKALGEIDYFTLAAWDSMTLVRPNGCRELSAFAAFIREGVIGLIEGREWRLNLIGAGHEQHFIFSRFVQRQLPDDPRIRTTYRCNDQLAVARWLAQELIAAKLASIAKCRRPACGRLFVVNKRQEYCSPRCSQIERSATWRNKNPVKASDLRHGAYERKVKREKGEKRVVKRRGARAKEQSE
jgi:hypothetical protein